MTQQETKHPEPTSKLIAWLEDTMAPDKPYKLTTGQVEKIKDVWDVLSLGTEFEYSLNEDFTKLIKRRK